MSEAIPTETSSYLEALVGRLNLNTGRAMAYRFSPAPGDGARHRYAIDRAILREHGVALLGPPAESIFAPLPRKIVLDVLGGSVRWHHEAGLARADDAVLNACRALRFATDGTWISKVAAGEWACGRLDDAALVEDALQARIHGRALDPARVERFLTSAANGLEDAAGHTPRHS